MNLTKKTYLATYQILEYYLHECEKWFKGTRGKIVCVCMDFMGFFFNLFCNLEKPALKNKNFESPI
jgi:hypothetical protein